MNEKYKYVPTLISGIVTIVLLTVWNPNLERTLIECLLKIGECPHWHNFSCTLAQILLEPIEAIVGSVVGPCSGGVLVLLRQPLFQPLCGDSRRARYCPYHSPQLIPFNFGDLSVSVAGTMAGSIINRLRTVIQNFESILGIGRRGYPGNYYYVRARCRAL